MITVNSDRLLYLNSAAGLSVTSTNTGIGTATEVARPTRGYFRAPKPGARFFQLHGVAKGSAFIQVTDASGLVITQVEVGTKTKLTKKVTFYFVTDTARPAPHSTRLSPAHSGEHAGSVNMILRQAAIGITTPPGATLTVDGNLGDVVTVYDGATDGWATLRALRDPGADHTVFFVWRFQRPVSAKARRPQRDLVAFDKMSIVAEDEVIDSRGRVIARELAHAFGLPYLMGNGGVDHLMGLGNGKQLDKSEINLINP